jgi:hypothetical protein
MTLQPQKTIFADLKQHKMALSEQEILVEKHSPNYANWIDPYPANEFVTTA